MDSIRNQNSNWRTPKGNPTVKWRGHSLTELRSALENAESYRLARRATLKALDAQVAVEDLRARTAVGLLLSVDPQLLRLGGYRCPESPTLRCLYDTSASRDDCDGTCLICGESEDRF
jgi:hypothetical protein